MSGLSVLVTVVITLATLFIATCYLLGWDIMGFVPNNYFSEFIVGMLLLISVQTVGSGNER